jgi:hypothetical protein
MVGAEAPGGWGLQARRCNMGMVHAGEAGLTSVVAGMGKVREALPDSVREAADRKLGADSPLGKGVLVMVDTVTAESVKAKATKATLAAKAAAAKAAAATAAEEKAVALVDATEAAAQESRGRGGRILFGGLALGAAAGAAYFVWRRRQQAASEQPGEGAWSVPSTGDASSATAFVPGVADEQSPDVVDEEFAHEVDEVADEFAAEVVDAIEVPGESSHGHVDDAPEPAEPFVPGVADEHSPDVVDEGLAAEIDGVADEIAASVVDALETSEDKGA